MVRSTTKKPTPRRAPAARRPKAVVPPVGEGASDKVEWPVDVARTVAKPVEKPVAPKAKPAVAPEPVAKAEPAAAPEPVVEPAAIAPEPVTIEAEPVAAALETALPEIPEPTAPAAELTKGSFIMTDAMETAKTYAEEAKTRIQSAVAEMNEKAKTAMEKSAKSMEEFGELAKGNMEAIVESSKIAAKGMESMSQEAVEFGRKSFETSTATFKKFAAVKSPTEFFQLHSELMSSAMDSFASEAAKSSEAMLKLAGDVSQPISNRVAIMTEKMKALAA